MKKNLLISILFILGSCTTTKYVYHVNDDLYYSSTNNRSQTYDTMTYDYVNDVDNFYYTNNLRRFYQPYFGLNYFNDYYVYRNPFWDNTQYVNFYNPYWGFYRTPIWTYNYYWNQPWCPNNWSFNQWNYGWTWNNCYNNIWNNTWVTPNTPTNTYYGSHGGNSSTNTNNVSVNKPFGNKVTNEKPITTFDRGTQSKPIQYEQKNYQNNIGSIPTSPTLINKQYNNRSTFQQTRPTQNNFQNKTINKGQIINSKPNLNPRLK